VAALTYARYHASIARESPDRPYDVDDTVQYQAYTGTKDSDPRSDRAVTLTSGTVMTYEKRLIQAFFSADSGGHTESAENAWAMKPVPYCVAKPELYTDAEIDLNRWGPWQARIDWSALNRKLLNAGVGHARHPVTGVRVLNSDRTTSGRARRVTLDRRGAPSLKVDATTFRRALGLRSTLIWMDGADASLLHGRGFGHGVGMSQLGAMTLAAKRGFSYRQILGFYFDGIEIVTSIAR
jgi:stage II sporulation protein D